MSLFAPARLLIKPQSKHSKVTQEIIRRSLFCNPNVSVEYLRQKKFEYPAGSPRDKFLYMADSLIVTERETPFIRTFDSPGDIVESLHTILNLSWMCVCQCEYCYLQTNQTPEHYVYTNLREAEHEIASAPAAHAAILTLWTHLQAYFGTRLMKLPDQFKETSDWLREFFVKARITSTKNAVARYYLAQDKLVKRLNKDNKSFRVDYGQFRRDRATIQGWYERNLQYPLTLTASEFTDFLAVDHLTGNSTFLMNMVEKYPRVNYTIRSKSAYVDEILCLDGHDRVKIQLTLNTEEAIRQFEHRTASLDERIHAARKVQEANGFILEIVLEPMIFYDGYREDYDKLVRRIFKELDPNKIASLTLGSLRFTGQLKAMAKMHYPKTALFPKGHRVVNPTKPDTKTRYFPNERKDLYAALRDRASKQSPIPIRLGSETRDLWKAVELDVGLELSGKVHETELTVREPQLDTKAEPIMVKKAKKSKSKMNSSPLANFNKSKAGQKKPKEPATLPEPKEEEILDTSEEDVSTMHPGTDTSETNCPFWISMAPQDITTIEAVLERTDTSIPHEQFDKVVQSLRTMVVASFEEDDPTMNIFGISTVDSWKVTKNQTLHSLLSKGPYFEPVKVIGRIASISSIATYDIEDLPTLGFLSLWIADTRGEKVQTLEIQSNKFVAVDLQKLCADRTQCTFFGAMVSVYPDNGKGKGKLRFFLHDLCPKIVPTDLLEWEPNGNYDGSFRIKVGDKVFGVPENHPSVLIKKHSGSNDIIRYIKNELSVGLGIAALDKANELDRALDFVILQAMSQGCGGFLEKLHTLVIGPPNVGKAYLTKAALILNTVGQEISSDKRKVTSAGLCGTVKTRSGKNQSDPGILPMNHGGVVCIQEFHDIRGGTRKAVCSVFVRMMEEGKVHESTSASTVHPAETALLLDMNRYSQVDRSGTFNSYTDIDIPINMLARFDHIIEIPRDTERSIATARQMRSGFKTMGAPIEHTTPEWQNRLKYLVAFLRTEYQVISFPQVVLDYAEERLEVMINQLTNSREMEILIEDMRLRMVRSVFKLTKAIATANATSVATKEHVDFALQFLKDKLKFVASINPGEIPVEKPDITDMSSRQNMIAKQFHGRKGFSIEDVTDFLIKSMEGDIDKRTIQRDLKAIGARSLKRPKGAWSLT